MEWGIGYSRIYEGVENYSFCIDLVSYLLLRRLETYILITTHGSPKPHHKKPNSAPTGIRYGKGKKDWVGILLPFQIIIPNFHC